MPLLLTLPGCLTNTLWASYEPAAAVVFEQLGDEHRRRDAGSVVPVAWDRADSLCWSADDGSSRWWLRPSPSADVAAVLLSDPELCEVKSANIAARHRYATDEITVDEASLELRLHVWPEAVGRVVQAADITPAAARMLATPRANAYALAADPTACLPDAFRRLARRLSAIDLGWLVGSRHAVHAASWVFVDENGRPILQPEQLVRGRISDTSGLRSMDGEVPLDERLAALAAAQLLVRLHDGERTTLVMLRPDRLWLLSDMALDHGEFVHRSQWRLEPWPQRRETPVIAQAQRIPSALQLHELHYDRFYQPVTFDGGLWGRVALTPLTLTADMLLGPGLVPFLRWLSGQNANIDRDRRRQPLR